MKTKSGLSWILGAGIVGADIGTSVLYSTGILFPSVGYLAPVFILIVCLMMWLFKRTYEEGLALSPFNGGAYVMILRSLGRQWAVLAGALTCVSYLATAAVSALSGAYYLSSLFSEPLSTAQIVSLSFVPIVLFALLNIKGMKEPAKLVTGIAATHFGLLMIISVWGGFYLLFGDVNLDLSRFSKITVSGELTAAMVVYGFAGAFLGITGFESAAQIVEELQAPVMATVRKLYKTVVILVSLTAPAISLLCVLILTENEILNNKEFLVSAVAEKLGGRPLLTIIVIDATLTLFGAVNTAFVGFIGLATTMAKQGNLPQVLLTRVAHRWKSLEGYPLIAIFFMVTALFMTAAVPGRVEVLAEVYGMAFLGVMVSFAIGVVLMRNRPRRKDTPRKYLSEWVIKSKTRVIPLAPFLSCLVLAFAQIVLVVSGPVEARNMLIQLLSLVILIMAFYRWGVLEQRLETHSDLRLGLGNYAKLEEMPDDLPKFVLCAGGSGARRLINRAMIHLFDHQKGQPFELIIFHAEQRRNEGFLMELLKRVVTQQIAPIYANNNCILTVKSLPGRLIEGLMTIKKTSSMEAVMIGRNHKRIACEEMAAEVEEELEVKTIMVDTF